MVSAWFDARRLRGSVPRGCLGLQLVRCGDRKSHLECQFHFRFWASICAVLRITQTGSRPPHSPPRNVASSATESGALYSSHSPCLLQTQASNTDNSVATARRAPTLAEPEKLNSRHHRRKICRHHQLPHCHRLCLTWGDCHGQPGESSPTIAACADGSEICCLETSTQHSRVAACAIAT